MALPPSIAPDAAVDLQLHTTYSDGSWTATQLLDYVARERFAVVAVTDHDRTDTVPEVQRLGAERGVRVLAAASFTTNRPIGRNSGRSLPAGLRPVGECVIAGERPADLW